MKKVGSAVLLSVVLSLTPGWLNADNPKSTGWLAQNSFLTQKTVSANPVTTQIKYTVQAGDSLWLIARQNFTTVEGIISLNQLDTDLLQIGQVLYLEVPAPNVSPALPANAAANISKTENIEEIDPLEAIDAQNVQQESKTPSRGNSSDSIAALLSTARQYTGVRYVYAGSGPNGFDCSGFTQFVFAKHGIKLPRCSYEQATVGVKITRAEARPGDLVFFNTQGGKQISHVGIYVGAGNFIHANTKKGVTTTTLDSGYFYERLVTIRRAMR